MMISPGESNGKSCCMSWSTAFPARTIIIILRGALTLSTKSLISVHPMIFFPLPRPLINRSTTPSSTPGTVRLYTATAKPLLSIFKTRFSPITASPIKPISAFLSIINILKFILIMTRVVINVITTLTNIHFMFNTSNLNLLFLRKKNNSNTYVILILIKVYRRYYYIFIK